jgi:hypothetical protein
MDIVISRFRTNLVVLPENPKNRMPDLFNRNDRIAVLKNELESEIAQMRQEIQKTDKNGSQTFELIHSWLSLTAHLLREHLVGR